MLSQRMHHGVSNRTPDVRRYGPRWLAHVYKHVGDSISIIIVDQDHFLIFFHSTFIAVVKRAWRAALWPVLRFASRLPPWKRSGKLTMWMH